MTIVVLRPTVEFQTQSWAKPLERSADYLYTPTNGFYVGATFSVGGYIIYFRAFHERIRGTCKVNAWLEDLFLS